MAQRSGDGTGSSTKYKSSKRRLRRHERYSSFISLSTATENHQTSSQREASTPSELTPDDKESEQRPFLPKQFEPHCSITTQPLPSNQLSLLAEEQTEPPPSLPVNGVTENSCADHLDVGHLLSLLQQILLNFHPSPQFHRLQHLLQQELAAQWQFLVACFSLLRALLQTFTMTITTLVSARAF
jgi:hypothetical protein